MMKTNKKNFLRFLILVVIAILSIMNTGCGGEDDIVYDGRIPEPFVDFDSTIVETTFQELKYN